MPTVQHSAIPEANLHEPKGVSTSTANKVYVANGSGSGTWRKTTDTDMDFSDKTKNKYGWNDISDSLYTSGVPRAINASTRTQITNNGAAAQSDTSRLGTLWNTATNVFLINDLNAAYTLRITGVVKTAAVAGTPYAMDIELESANGPTVIAACTQIIKGGSYANHVALTLPFYNGSFINNQNLTLYITADQNITLYNIGFMLERTYLEV